MEFSSEVGRSTPPPSKRLGKLFLQVHKLLHSCTRALPQPPQKRKKKKKCAQFSHTCTCSQFFFPPLAGWRRLPVLFYLSCHIQSMNAPSQQVWTQLLNIQLPPALPSSHHRCRRPPSTLLVSSSSSSSSLPLAPSLPLQLSPALAAATTTTAAAAAAACLCAPLSLRGSPLMALHITLNHHNNKSTLTRRQTTIRGAGGR